MTDWTSVGTDTSDSGLTDVTATNGSEGTWTSLGTLGNACDAIWVYVHKASTNKAFYVDIGTGAGGSPTLRIENLVLSETINQNSVYYFPVDSTVFSSGETLQARARTNSATGSEVISVAIIGSSEAVPGITSPSYETVGVDETSTDAGTALDPGGTVNTEGTWTEITGGSAVGASVQHICLVCSSIGGALTTADWLFDIGVWTGATTATEIISDVPLAADTGKDQITPRYFIFPAADFQSARISMRARCSINDATDRLLRVAMYAVSGTAITGGGGGGGVKLAGMSGGLIA